MKRFIIFFIFVVMAGCIYAQQGKKIHVISHNKVMMVTNPSKGINSEYRWARFPGLKTPFRKIVLNITYQCPDSLHCGEWDYVDGVFLTQSKNMHLPTNRIELARIITPYGWRFDNKWKFTWQVDITDFSLFLRDSVEIELYHSGYENNKDRGWVVTLDFEITEGKPAMLCAGMDTLWSGNIAYGDSLNPFENRVSPKTFTTSKKTDFARIRIVQTGHGMDDKENCAEFCSKWRKTYFDNTVVNERQVWKTCGENPLYPQAGTWIFNRANWCPGSVVEPETFDFYAKSKSTHSVDLEMEPYVNSGKPTAVYNISSYLFYYKKTWAKNDVELTEIVTPSLKDIYLRQNPVCSNPVIKVRNHGQNTLKQLTIVYGVKGTIPVSYTWNGELQSQKITEIVLPGLSFQDANETTFEVRIEKPNGKKDEYPADNALNSEFHLPPVMSTEFIVAFRSNHDSTHTSYTITSSKGDVVYSRRTSDIKPNVLYYDTIRLKPGCYQLFVVDTADDGLEFWFNPEGGYGYFRILNIKGELLRAFDSDFGSSINYWFSVQENAVTKPEIADLPIANPFPVRNQGIFEMEIFLNKAEDVTINILNNEGKKIFSMLYPSYKAGFLPIDISKEADGIYTIQVLISGKTTSRKIRVKHKE